MDSGIVIIGTGGLAKEIWGMLDSMGIEVTGFIAENERSGHYCGLRILGDDSWFVLQPKRQVIIANGKPEIRQRIAGYYADSAHEYLTVIHPGAFRLGDTILGRGVIVMPSCVLMPDVIIDEFTHVNMGVTIGHDTRIGRWCVINHNAALSGRVTIGDGVLVGAGASIREGVTIGAGATIGMGAAVVCDVPPGETWVGVPARKLDRQ